SHVPDEHPNARKLIMVHSVAGGGEQPFMDTSGLHRYGLPELYVPEVANGSVNQITQLMNAAAQVLLDGGDVDEKGQIAIDFKKLGWDVGIIEKGTGKAVWNTRWTKEPDTGERMLELVPPTGTGIVELEKMIDECFGSRPDKVTMLKDDDPELLAAGKHARADLVRLRGHFAKGIPLGERLTVKAKFTGTDNAVEWMWVDVVAFKRDTLEGTLANDPEVLTSMSNGQKVKVRLADVADYFHETKSGESAGGYSIEIFRKRGLLPEGY
ncbi:MAG TPA: DUF2314 domain-containing protein, partial [Kofleriaceae bacterium]|nr:DUF2314 domain-containing protein [Kofleriaceae bacterium]